MTIQRTLWNVHSGIRGLQVERIPGAAPAGAVNAARKCRADEAALVRLQVLAQALDDVAAAQGTAIPASVLSESFARWQSELDVAQRRFLQVAEQLAGGSDIVGQAQMALDLATKVRQRLIQAGVINEDLFVAASPEDRQGNSDESVQYYEMVGAGSELRLAWQSGELDRQLSGGAIGFGIGALTLMGWIALQFASARDWLAANCHLVLGIGGIAWWLAAPLGWLGWLLVAAAVWLAFRTPQLPAVERDGGLARRFANTPLH
jgi:hypothetical protein